MEIKILGDLQHFWQWDTNRKLLVDDDGKCKEVHFSNGNGSALVCVIKDENGKRVVDVPNILLQQSNPICAYMYIETEDEGYTQRSRTFAVRARAMPSDYVYTKTEILNYKNLDDRLKKLEGEGIGEVVEDYLEKNPLKPGATKEEAEQIQQNKTDIEQLETNKLDANKLPEAVNEALAQAKTSGEFKGEPGPTGPPGEKGDTPARGIDYWTDDDKTEIIEEVMERVSEGEDVDLSGYVKTVNGISPDENGNVEINIPDSGGNVAVAGQAKLPMMKKYGNILSEKENTYCTWPFGMCQYDEEIDKVVFMYNASPSHGNGPCSVYMRTIDCTTLEVSDSTLVADKITIGGTVYCAVSYMFFIKSDGSYQVIVKASEYNSTEKAVAYYKYLSTDKGATWTSEATDIFEKMTAAIGGAKNCYAPTRLSNGRIICTAIGNNQGAMYSDDDGDTWNVAYMNAGTSWEGCIIELGTPGHLCCINRHSNTYDKIVPAWLNYSEDYGMTWTTPVESASIPDMTSCNCCYVTDDDGRVNLFYGSRYNAGAYTATMYKQSGTLEQLASDTLDAPVVAFRGDAVYGGDFGYPACCKDRYGQMYIVYYDGDSEVANTYCTIKLAIASRQQIYTPINDNSFSNMNVYSAAKVEELLAALYNKLNAKINNIIIEGGGSVEDEGDGSYPVTSGLVTWYNPDDVTNDGWVDAIGGKTITPARYDADTKLVTCPATLEMGVTTDYTSEGIISFEFVINMPGTEYVLTHSRIGTLDANVMSNGYNYKFGDNSYTYGLTPQHFFKNRITHAVFNNDFVNGVGEVYINGKLAIEAIGTFTDDGIARKWIMASGGGKLGDIRVYNKMLTADEVANNYKYEQGRYTFNPVS